MKDICKDKEEVDDDLHDIDIWIVHDDAMCVVVMWWYWYEL